MTKRIPALDSRDEMGMALVTVIAMTSVLAILMVAAVSMAVGGLQKSRNDQDWSAALAAAYAGVEEYQSRLADDPAYWKFGAPTSVFSNPGSVADPGVALPTASHVNPAFGLGAAGTWAVVGNSDEDDDGATAHFRYEVNNTDYNSKGVIQLRSTGRVGEETRTLVAHVRQSGFLDFVYFTDFEYRDPALTGSSCNGEKHRWESGYSCGSHVIQFGDDDILDGPVHSNDTIRTCSAEFRFAVTTGAPDGAFDMPSGSCSPDWQGGPPTTVPLISMPETNDVMQRYTRSDLQAEDVPNPGCMYTGPTDIKLNSNGTMTVKSPWTRYTNVTGDDLRGGTTNNTCGTIAALSGAGATVVVPANNVIYVQSIPTSSANANYSSTSDTTGSSSRCKTRSGSNISRTSTHDETVNAVGYPRHFNELAPRDGTTSDASYGCRNGDLFIEGTLSGTSVTFAAQNYIYVTGNIRYRTGEPDTKLGLIGTNAVWVWNPMTSGGTPLIFPTSSRDRRIDGAVMSVQHSFGVQNYDRGDYGLGDLTIYGALVQKYRGTVGTAAGYGFDKDYRYDPDFQYNPPPHFLSPTNSVFGVKTWIEVSAAFHADGTYR